MSETYKTPAVIYVLALAQFSTPFMFAGVGIALPAMGRELQATGVQLGLIEMAYLGAASAFLLPVGRYSDLTDRTIIFKVGLLVYALSTLLIGFLNSALFIIGARFIQGVSAALIMATNMAILTREVPREKLGSAIGINIGAVYLGLSAGPFVAGWITNHWGWRWVFHFTFIPLILSFMLILVVFESSWKKRSVAFDWTGTAIISVTIFLLVFGSSQLGESVVGAILCVSGLIFAVLFFAVESRKAHPLIDIRSIKRNTTLSVALIIQLMMYAGAFGISFLFSIYLQTVKGLTPQSAGQILVISPIVMAVFAPICGRLSDRFSPQMLATIGLVCSLTGIIAATQVTMETEMPLLLAILVCQGLGFAMFSSPNMAIIMNSVSPSEYGVASALAANLRTLGMVFSMIIITVFLSIFLGDQMIDTHPSQFVSALRLSFLVFALFAGTGVILSFKRAS